mgnify:CR=1 FL=1
MEKKSRSFHLPLLRRFVGCIVGVSAQAGCRDGNWANDVGQFADARQEHGVVDDGLEGGRCDGARHVTVIRLAHALQGFESSSPAGRHTVVDQVNDAFVQSHSLVTGENEVNVRWM